MPDGPVRLPATSARRVAIAEQQLGWAQPQLHGRGVLEITHGIGYLQLDPTNVVARNPVQVLWSRIGAFEAGVIDDLLRRRHLFETPSLILPKADLPVHLATMRRYRRATDPNGANPQYRPGDNAGGGTWAPRVRKWLAKNQQMRRAVLVRLRREGPLPLSAFEDRAIVSWTSGGWNDERNVTMLLAILQRRGEVMVVGRQRGQKLYGLPNGFFDGVRPLSGVTLHKEATRRALRILGVATLKQLRWQYAFGRHVKPEALAALERAGEVVRVEIVGDDGALPGKWYALANIEERVREVNEQWEPRTTLLSPFDNLIIDRDRTLLLFDYFYRMEIYVPPAKRKLGYWAMPVLHGDRIVGSVDPRFDRKAGVLIVNKVVLQPNAPRSAMPAIRRTVKELAEWVGAKKVRWPATT